MASGSLGNLTVDLLLETLQWGAGLNKAEYQAEQFADAIEKKFNRMTANVGEMLKGVAAGMVAGFAVDRLAGFVNEVQKSADAMDEMAQKAGTSVEFMAEMSVMAGISGTSVEALAGAMGKFNKAILEAAGDSASKPAKVFEALKIELRDGEGALKTSEQLYTESALALGKLEDGAIKSAAAQALYGKSGAELIPLLNAQARASDELKASTKAYGEEIKKLAPIAGALEEQQAIFSTNSKALAAIVGEQLIPYFSELYRQWNQLTKAGSGLGEVGTVLLNSFKVIVIAVDAVVTTFKDLITIVVGAFKVFSALQSRDLKAAGAAFNETMKDLSESGANFGKRMEALLDPISAVTVETNKGDKASKALEEALKAQANAAKLAAEKHKILLGVLAAEAKGNAMLQEAIELGNKFLLDQDKKNAKEREQIAKQVLDAELANQKILEEAQLLGAKFVLEQDKKLAKEREAQWGEFYKQIDGMAEKAFGSMFDGTSESWTDMLDGMARDFKKILLAEIYKSTVKPFVIEITNKFTGANMSGGSSLLDTFSQFASSGEGGGFDWSGMATSIGTGIGNSMFESGSMSWTGAGSSMGAGVAGIAGGLVGGYGAGALGAGDKGVAAGQQWGSTLAMIGMQIYGPIGAAIGAVLGIVIGKATDPDPDAMRRAKFGSTTGAVGLTEWQGKSAFGSFGFSEGEWLSSEQMGDSMNAFITSIETIDNAFAQFMTPEAIARVKGRLEEASKTYELGMEHLDVTGLADVLLDRLAIISSGIDEGLSQFVAAFEGNAEDLVSVIGSFLAIQAGTANFDPAAIVEAMQPKALMEAYQEGAAALYTYMDTVDTSATSIGGLVLGMQAFQEATVQMILVIDEAAASMHAMFTETADGIRQSLMTEEERYKFLQDRADSLFAELMTETDPAKIANLASRINDDINSAWGMLDETQRSALGEQYLTRLDTLDQTVADKMQGLRDVVIEDSDTMMETIAAKLEELFKAAADTAAIEDEAADKMLDAANTMAGGLQVHVNTETVNGE